MKNISYMDSKTLVRITEVSDLGYLTNHLRQEDVAEIMASSGLSPRDALYKSRDISSICLTLLYEGIPTAVFGINAPILTGDVAVVWLLGTPDIRKMRRRFYILSRFYISEFLRLYPILLNMVSVEHKESIAWLKRLGAVFAEPTHCGYNGELFMQFTIRRKSNVCTSNGFLRANGVNDWCVNILRSGGC